MRTLEGAVASLEVQVARLTEKVKDLEKIYRDGEFLDFLRRKFGDEFQASLVGHVDEEIPE